MSSSDKSPAVSRVTAPTPSAIKRAASPRKPVQQSLLLPAATGTPPQRQAPPRTSVRERLWFCIHLPALPLEALDHPDSGGARAVFEEVQGIRRVLLASPEAEAAGIVAGLSVNAALSLLPGLSLGERSPDAEARVLEGLAAWAERFTSFVAIEPPSELLLEIAGSLRLFDGMAALRQRIGGALARRGFTTRLAIAPTPLASTWLARAGRQACIDDTTQLAGSLGPLPLCCLEWPDAVIESLRGMGVTCIADCLRLPRQGFARRFGVSRLLQLDRALGRLPDPRTGYRAAERFCVDQDLESEQSDSELLLHVCHGLLMKLELFLLTRQMQVQHVQFSFFHLQAAATQLTLGCAQPGRSVDHWFDLLRIKFDRIVLPAPVIAIRLRGGPGQLLSAETKNLLFDGSAKRRNVSIACLVERLSARLGDAAVHGVTTVAEHRPQYAWRPADVLDEVPRCAAVPDFRYQREAPHLFEDGRRTDRLLLRRPLWMLEEAERLASEHDRPVYQGPLELIDGPERLESGWWDDEGIARDYFVARTAKGMHLWVYRDRGKDAAWYLHGIFG